MNPMPRPSSAVSAPPARPPRGAAASTSAPAYATGPGVRVQQPKLPAGTHLARCCGWVELGTLPDPFAKGKGQRLASLNLASQTAAPQVQKWGRRVMITFQIVGPAGERWRISREVAVAFGPRAGLRKLLEGWRGRPYADEAALRAVVADPRRVLEQPALVVIGHTAAKPQAGPAQGPGQAWPRLEGVVPVPAGMAGAVEPLRWPPVLFTWERPDRAVFRTLPLWVRRKMRGSREWQALLGQREGR